MLFTLTEAGSLKTPPLAGHPGNCLPRFLVDQAQSVQGKTIDPQKTAFYLVGAKHPGLGGGVSV